MHYTSVLQMPSCKSKMAFILNLIVDSSVGCTLNCPLFPYLEVQCSELPPELPTELPTISVYGSSGQLYLHSIIPMGSPLRCPLPWPLSQCIEVVGSLICMVKFSWAAHSDAHYLINGRRGQPNLHGKIPLGSPWIAHSTAH